MIHKKIISLREGEEEAGGHRHLVSLPSSTRLCRRGDDDDGPVACVQGR